MASGPDPRTLADLQAASFETATAATSASWPPERRMTGEQLDRVLRRRLYAVVASSRPDQRPHATPSAFLWHRDELWLPAVAGAVRVRNLSASPWLVAVISEGEGPQHAVVIMEGPARVLPVTDAPVEDLSESIAAKSSDFSYPDWASVWLVLQPERLLSYAAPDWKAP
jgi:nitroimidazol reductase NimA-like FMN-containing flavoprotein (pyridoxamine 5'-phosphate oxidase superfamily)